MKNSYLQGIRIIALTWVWAGPWTGSVLADMGAEVIKVESNKRLDSSRYLPPFPEGKQGVNRSQFNFVNRGTKSCTIDLKIPQGVELFKDLVKVSDVVITNYPPRVLPKLGLDYEALKQVKQDIIMVSLSGFGNTGPDKDYTAYASTVEAASGLIASYGYPGREPSLGSVYSADPVGSMYGVFGTLNALYYRQKTGKGQFVDISMVEGITSLIPETIIEYTMNNTVRLRMGNRDQIMAPHNCYPSKGQDKWVAIAVSNDDEWMALCQAMGNPPWSQEARFADQFSRWQNQEELDKFIALWTKDFTHYEIMHKLQELGVAAGPSLNIEELINDPHLLDRDMFVKQSHPEVGNITVFRSPWTSAETKHNPPAPCLGEHNHYVFSELLNMSDEDISGLVEQNIIY